VREQSAATLFSSLSLSLSLAVLVFLIALRHARSGDGKEKRTTAND